MNIGGATIAASLGSPCCWSVMSSLDRLHRPQSCRGLHDSADSLFQSAQRGGRSSAGFLEDLANDQIRLAPYGSSIMMWDMLHRSILRHTLVATQRDSSGAMSEPLASMTVSETFPSAPATPLLPGVEALMTRIQCALDGGPSVADIGTRVGHIGIVEHRRMLERHACP